MYKKKTVNLTQNKNIECLNEILYTYSENACINLLKTVFV